MRRVMVTVPLVAAALAGCSGGSADNGFTAAPAPATTAAAVHSDWPTYHGSNNRAGDSPTALRGTLRRSWSTRLDGALYAQPLVAGGLVVAATENNTVYGLDATSGRVRWRRHLADPARRADLPCGNIDPSGITGTPAYDAATHQVFVATENRSVRHTLVALDVRTGKTRWHRSLDVLPSRDPRAQQQRSALLVAHSRVYVAFGGRFGDCGNYVGYVIGIATSGAGSALRYAVPTAREAGIWAPPGLVTGANGDLYVASGNGAETGGRYDGSDSVIRLSPTLRRRGFFAPSTWRDDNAQDLDLGSMAPVPVGNRIVIAGKRGTVFLLSSELGGIGRQLATLNGCAGFGGAAAHGAIVLLPCDDGVRALRVESGRMRWLWHDGALSGSPVVVGDSALGFDGRDLVRVDLATGHRRDRVRVGDVTRFTTPAPAGGFVYVGTKAGDVVAISAR